MHSEFPYVFTEDGCLHHRDTHQPYRFTFRVEDVRGTDQEHRALCRYITQHVYHLLERKFHLTKVNLEENDSFVFMSPRALENPRSLLVLIQDVGTMQSGVWSWKVVAHEGLEKGSQIPYIRWALTESCAVLLLNPNQGGQTLERHVQLVWDSLISTSCAEHIFVVAHGYGGLAFVDLLCRSRESVQQRVKAVAFLDSSHNLWHQPLGKAGRDWMKAHSRTWTLSTKPLNRSVGSMKAGCPQISAGTQSHGLAPAICMESVLRFFDKLIKPKSTPVPFEMITRSKSKAKDLARAKQ